MAGPSDRLSSLPDDILANGILSRLPIKQSIATSILSRRWSRLWQNVPSLHFIGYNNMGDYLLDLNRDDRREYHFKGQLRGFSEIIQRSLALYKVERMKKFCIVLAFEGEDLAILEDSLKEIILNVMSRGVEDIGLRDRCGYGKLPSPTCLFNCDTLVSLSLENCNIPLLSECSLSRLKNVILRQCRFNGDENFSLFISRCPWIKYLKIEELIDVRFCRFSSARLEAFHFERYGWFLADEHDNGCLEINAPELRYVYLNDQFSKHISFQGLNSLIAAKINVRYVAEYLMRFIGRMHNAMFIDLTINYEGFPESTFAARLGFFSNLTRLEIRADWRLISKFLESAANLEELIVHDVMEIASGEGEVLKLWREPDVVPTCLLSHLTTVDIIAFECLEDEFEMVRYLLKYGRVLERVKIAYFVFYCEEYEYERIREVYKITHFERASESCEIIYRSMGS